MNTRILVSMLAVSAIAVLANPAEGCSTFCLAGAGPVFGKNYDWDVADGLVIVNKRGVAKTAMTNDNPAKWTSKYGSVTFNQYGREMPCGGINEAGRRRIRGNRSTTCSGYSTTSTSRHR
jgi:choloylglycine hydrolase